MEMTLFSSFICIPFTLSLLPFTLSCELVIVPHFSLEYKHAGIWDVLVEYNYAMSTFGWYDNVTNISNFFEVHSWALLPLFLLCVCTVTVVFFLIFIFLENQLFSHETKGTIQRILFAVSASILGVIGGGFIFLILISSTFDNDTYWWIVEEPARKIVTDLYSYHDKGRSWPKNQQELYALFPNQMSFLEKNSKVKYISDEQGNFFVFFVRPSKYFVLIFSSYPKLKYDRFALDQAHKNLFPALGKQYPPSLSGPWEQLPQ